jgi:hypothetical protein
MNYRSFYILIAIVSLSICFPMLIWNFPDHEDLHTTLFSSFHFRDFVLKGYFPLWNSFLGFGTIHPSSNTLDGHPIGLLISPENFKFSIFFFYAFHSFLGGVFIFKICKLLETNSIAALIGSFTFQLCSTTTSLTFIKLVPIHFLAWSMLPLILYLLIKLTIQFQKDNNKNTLYFLCLCAVIVLLIKWCHVGTIASYGLVFLIFSVSLIWKNPFMIKPLLLVFLIVISCSLDKIYVLVSETFILNEASNKITRISGHKNFDYFSFWSMFFKPLVPTISPYEFIKRNVTYGEATDPIWNTLIFIGPIYSLLAVYGLFSKKIYFKFKNAFVVTIIFSFLMMIMPVEFHKILIIPAANFLYRDTFILFLIVLGTITFSNLLNILKKKKNIKFLVISFLQCFFLIVGTFPYILFAINQKKPSHIEVLQSSKKISHFIEKHRKQPSSLAIISSSIEKSGPIGIKGWAGEMNNSLAIWQTPFLNGYFKFFAMNRVAENKILGVSQLHGFDLNNISQEMLDVLGVEFIFLNPDELKLKNLKELKELKEFVNIHNTILLQNKSAWPKVNFFKEGFLKTNVLKRLTKCEMKSIFCYDFSSIHSSRLSNKNINIISNTIGEYKISISPNRIIKSGLLTESFRDEWEASADGKKINLYRTIDNFIGFDIPINTKNIIIKYNPKIRLIFIIIQHVFLLFCALYYFLFIINNLKNKKRNVVLQYGDEFNSLRKLKIKLKHFKNKIFYTLFLKYLYYISFSYIISYIFFHMFHKYILNLHIQKNNYLSEIFFISMFFLICSMIIYLQHKKNKH